MLTTERLVVRQANLDDAPFIQQLLNTDTWLKFIGDRNIDSLEAAEGYIRNALQASYDKHGFGLYLVTERSGSSIGLCGLLQRDDLPLPDLGYALVPEKTGQGLAKEAAEAVLAYEVPKHGLSEVWAITSDDNVRSAALLKRLGFHADGRVKMYGEDLLKFRWPP